jgi:serine/threonine-protein kinase PRP4
MSSLSNIGNRSIKRPRLEADIEENHENGKDEINDLSEMETINEDLVLRQMMNGVERDEEQEELRRRERERKRLERQKRVNDLPTISPKQIDESDIILDKGSSSLVTMGQRIHNANDERPNIMLSFNDDDDDDNNNNEQDDENNDFDMFSSSISPILQNITSKNKLATTTKIDDFQDAEGYYKAAIGETMTLYDNYFKVLGVVGKGVFSTVLKCSVENTEEKTSLPSTVALKFIRHNETMSRAAQNEVMFLKKLNHPHIINLELPMAQQQLLEHRGHVVMVFPYLSYNLRDVLQKFGKGVGLSLQAVRTYFYQLLSALMHLEDCNIIHADIKPDNMLVTEDFNTVKLCDFGSAMESGSADAVPTPYLVSRFYRAPDIILGVVPTPAVDLWSVGVTVAEIFLGRLLFQGHSNNEMLGAFMETMGPFSAKTIRQHLVQVNKLGIPAHFTQRQQNFIYLQETSQILNGKQIVKEIHLQIYPTSPIQQRLFKAKSSKDPRLDIQQFGALLQKVLCLEVTKRISVSEALKHGFFINS